jgi:hypothetical protein
MARCATPDVGHPIYSEQPLKSVIVSNYRKHLQTIVYSSTSDSDLREFEALREPCARLNS